MDPQNVLGQSNRRGSQFIPAVVHSIHRTVSGSAMEDEVHSEIGKTFRVV
jgi:hypothetical protein